MSIRMALMYNKTWKSLVHVGILIFKIECCIYQLQDAKMVYDILDHSVKTLGIVI